MTLPKLYKTIEDIFEYATNNAKGELISEKDPYHRRFTHTSQVYDFCEEHLSIGHKANDRLEPILIAALLHDIAILYSSGEMHELRLIQEMIDIEQHTNFSSRLNTLIMKTYGRVDNKVNSLPAKRIQEKLRSILKEILDQYIGKQQNHDWDLIKICILATNYRYMSSLTEEQMQIKDLLLSNALGDHLPGRQDEKNNQRHVNVKEVKTLIKTHLHDENLENLHEHLIFHNGLKRIAKTYSETYHTDPQRIFDQIHLIRSSDLCSLFDLDKYHKVEPLLIETLNDSTTAKNINDHVGYKKEKYDWNLTQIKLALDLYIMHTRLSINDTTIIQDKYILGLESVILELTARLWKYAT